MLRLPVLDLPAHSYRVSIEGVEYTLRLQYQTRADSWYVDIGDAVGNWISRGVRMVQGWPLFERVQDSRLPPGKFYVLLGESDSLGREGFNNGARFLYWTIQDLLDFTPDAPEEISIVSII